MTVGAAPVEIAYGIERLRGAGMTAGHVAGIANPRHAHSQQLRIVAAMRLVAVGAVLHDRRMLPEEGTAPLGVAAETVLGGRGLQQLLWIGTSVRVMATGAGHLAFAIGHVRRALQLGAAHLMALQAEFRLGFLRPLVFGEGCRVTSLRRQRRVNLLFHLMTLHAGNSARFVGAAFPEQAISIAVAGQAGGILFFDGVGGILAEADGNSVFAAAAFYVRLARSMASFAALRLQRGSGMGHDFAHDRVLEAILLVLVTGDAHVRAGVLTARLGWLGRGRVLSGRGTSRDRAGWSWEGSFADQDKKKKTAQECDAKNSGQGHRFTPEGGDSLHAARPKRL